MSAFGDAAPPSPTGSEILVCYAGTCRARGAEAVLTEIEELASAVGAVCAVRPSGCLGYCSEAPNVVVQHRGARAAAATVHVRIRSLEASAKVVEHASGKKPQLEDAGVRERFDELRAVRARQHASSVAHWNAALRGFAEQAAKQPALHTELEALLAKAGFPDGMLGAAMPSSIEGYSQWLLESVSPVSKRSALFRFTSDDRKRGTPHPRGYGRMIQPITWHTTLLAEVGSNDEGPLPWVERDYTPISSAKDWEKGRCELLVKVYPRGAATSWLRSHSEKSDVRVWLSKPTRTLHMPGLVTEGRSFRPASVLLLLAGTGVVALPQVLAHRDPMRQLAISTPKRDQLPVPIDVVLSCRQDDVLLVPHIAQWCRAASEGEASGVRHCTLLLTPPVDDEHEAPPFLLDAPAGDAAEADRALDGLANARILRSRLNSTILAEAFDRMPRPCRVVVSGPGEFNSAARGMLAELTDDAEEIITVLSA